jgi:hypothetical protein
LTGFSLINTAINTAPPPSSTSAPTVTASETPTPQPSPLQPANPNCPASQYFYATKADWEAANTDEWLDQWWTANNASFASQGGFVSTLGAQYMNQPGFTCSQVSSSSDCGFDPCDISIANPAAPGNVPDQTVRQPYYVLESVRRFHDYFMTLSETLQSSTIGGALRKDQWALSFYRDKKAKDSTLFKEIANAGIVLVALACAVAGALLKSAAWLGSLQAGSIMFSGISFAFILMVKEP